MKLARHALLLLTVAWLPGAACFDGTWGADADTDAGYGVETQDAVDGGIDGSWGRSPKPEPPDPIASGPEELVLAPAILASSSTAEVEASSRGPELSVEEPLGQCVSQEPSPVEPAAVTVALMPETELREGFIPLELFDGLDDADEADQAPEEATLLPVCDEPDEEQDDCWLSQLDRQITGFSPDGQRVAIHHVLVEGAGSGCVEVSGKVAKSYNLSVVEERHLASIAACVDSEEDEDPRYVKRARRWLERLGAKGFVPARHVLASATWDDEQRALGRLSGPLNGWLLYARRVDQRLELWLVSSDNQHQHRLTSRWMKFRECYRLDGERWCNSRHPLLLEAVLTPNGKRLIVAVGVTGENCWSDILTKLWSVRLPEGL